MSRSSTSARSSVRSLLVGIAIASLSLTAAAGTSKAAGTTVGGDREVNSPLVIDPSKDPLTLPVEFDGSPIMYIQRMPQTKEVRQVTLGNIGRADGCGPTTAQLLIREYKPPARGNPGPEDDGDLGISLMDPEIFQYYASESRDLAATPERVSWTMTPTRTFKRGYGYGFQVRVTGCTKFNQTTWAHADANGGLFTEVNGGPYRCELGPFVGPENRVVGRRMWHETGSFDPQPGCEDRVRPWANLDERTQTGWALQLQERVMERFVPR